MAILIAGLGGSAGFGEGLLDRNDDSSTGAIDISSIFENGLNFYGNVFTSLYVNNNGSVTFNAPRSSFTPSVITETSNNPEITPFFGDVDTRSTDPLTTSPGGNSQGTNLVYYDLDTVNDRVVVTWDDVGFYSYDNSKINAFQLILSDQGGGDFDIQFRYEAVNWTTGNASGGTDGLGGTVARAGWTAGTGDPTQYFELPQSGDQGGMLSLESVAGNTGIAGLWEFAVRSGAVRQSTIPTAPTTTGVIWGDPHIVTMDGMAYDFMAVGDYVALESTVDDFELQVRNFSVGTNVSAASGAAVKYGGHTVVVSAQAANALTIDGVATSLANDDSTTTGTTAVYRTDNTYTIVLAGNDGVINAGDDQIVVDIIANRVDLKVSLNDSRAGTVQGLLGNFNGNAADDFQGSTGTLPAPPGFNSLYGDFQTTWTVASADNLFNSSGVLSAANANADSPTAAVTLDDLSPAQLAAAQQAAQNAGLTPGTFFYDSAVLDYALTGDTSYLTSAETASAATVGATSDSGGGSTVTLSTGSNDGVYDVHRFYNTQTGAHFYTADDAEAQAVIDTLPQYSYEGNGFDSNETSATGSPIYRFYNTQTNVHFYTANESERDSIIENLPEFSYEGVAYYAATSPGGSLLNLHRFYNTATNTHFYTSSDAEQQEVAANEPQYNYEDVAYYVDVA
jgi:hypothetical protein